VNVVVPPVPLSQAPSKAALYAFAPDLALPRTTEWSVTLDQAIGSAQRLTVSYVAATGRDLLLRRNVEYPPQFLIIRSVTNEGLSAYCSVQLQFQRRLRNGLQALLSYTWAHATDTVSQDIAEYTILAGDADFDVRHNVSSALSYDVPGPAWQNKGAMLFRDWS